MAEFNLFDRIQLGENSTLELKCVDVAGQRVNSPDRRDFADELAAMANSRGGTVVLGVDDASKEVIGIPLNHLDIVEGWAREICNDSVKPALDADIRKFTLNNSDGRSVPIVRIDVARSFFVHKSPGGYFLRIGNSKREMSPEFIARQFQERSYSRLKQFDETIVPGTARSDLHYELRARCETGESFCH